MTIAPPAHALSAPSRRIGRALAAAVAVLTLGATACAGDDAAPSAVSTGITQLTTSSRAAESGPITIMPLGDSLTAGDDPTRPTTSPQSYRGYLYNSLLAAGYDVDFVGSQQNEAISGGDPDHEGHGGYTIGPDNSTLCDGCGPANLDSGLEGWLTASTPDIVLLMAGVNDLLPQSDPASGLVRDGVPGDAGKKLEALVKRIRTISPDTVVIVASYPPTSFLVDPALDSLEPFTGLNDAAKKLGDGSDPQVLYAPMFETFEGSWTDADTLGQADQLHPSATGAKRIAGVWLEVLEPLLDERN